MLGCAARLEPAAWKQPTDRRRTIIQNTGVALRAAGKEERASMTDPAATPTLLPGPKDLSVTSGFCAPGPDLSIDLRIDDARVGRAARKWRSTLASRSGGSHPPRSAPMTLQVVIDRTQTRHDQGYRLTVKPRRIELVGGSPRACFYGLQTLEQLSRSHAAPDQAALIPCCEVVDAPDFHSRGLLYDVTRGKVPTLDTLKMLVDRLASLKINQLQLYIEHAFVFRFDPQICSAEQGLTPDDVGALDAYCRERFIDLVPALATPGHMGRILSMPKYRHLAEIETTTAWERMSWPQRMRGLTLDCMNPEAHRLVERMWSDVLDAFSSPVVNLCGDEPWDLGRGKNRRRFTGNQRNEAYLNHIRRTHDLCARRGRRTQFWSDVVRNEAMPVDRVPRTSTILHWGYDDRADYDGTSTWVEAGLDTFVCPGTSGWKRIINAMDAAERNIAAFAAAGRAHGASGLLNTDWGDHGHFNLPACSWHGIALGAALAWDASHPTGERFDRPFARWFFGADDTEGVALLRKGSRLAERCETWRLLWMPLAEIAKDATLPTSEAAEESRHFALEAMAWLARTKPADDQGASDLRELGVACRFQALLADKVGFARQHPTRAAGFSPREPAPADRQASARETSRRLKPAAQRDGGHGPPYGRAHRLQTGATLRYS
ncbi:MAG: family 20 glycosylhydrolase [Planctomycetes bacterium]|nr:family 20 glycosylhydrolase [Planctomycetota bacterium]